ncbi:MAG: hypothetical protein ACLQGP_02370 [Isosphaeraceae bacterium]
MSTTDPDFYQSKPFSPEGDASQPRQRGCLFYGCLITGILALLLAIAIGTITFLLYRSFTQFVEENTATAPRELPKVEASPEERVAIKKKLKGFEKVVDANEPVQTLVLTANELNALIDENPDLKGQIYLDIEGDRIKGKLSIALDKFSRVFEKIGIKMLRGRYFNGEVELSGSFSDGSLKLDIESLEVNGRSLPEPAVTQINDMIIQFSKDPEVADEARKIDSIEVKDGKVIIKTRGKSRKPEPNATPAPKDLPEQVLAPPDAGKTSAKPSDVGAPAGTATPASPGEPSGKP